MFEAVAVAQSMSRDVAMAQIATAATAIFCSLVFAIGYYLVVKRNGAMLIEMRRENRSGGGPDPCRGGLRATAQHRPRCAQRQGGSARDITFEFSAPVEDLKGFVVSDLPYLKRGVNFLGPGSQVACYWDDLEPLVASLREKGLDEGISVTVKYRDLTGDPYETRWTINPLLYEGNRHVPREGLGDGVSALEKLHETLSHEAEGSPEGNARPEARPEASPLKRP